MNDPEQTHVLWIIIYSYLCLSSLAHVLRVHNYNRNGGKMTYSDCVKYELLLAEIHNKSIPDTREICNNLFLAQMRTLSEQLRDPNVTNYVRHLLRGVRAEMDQHENRHKRSIFSGGVRIRREIREPPYDRNWGCFARGVRRLKNNYDVRRGMNTYDVIASLHTDHHVKLSSHDGPAFFSWHREYLRIMELAIGCPIPYWDTTLDEAMEHPEESKIWTDKYFGNGYGTVTTGIMKNLYSPIPVIRSINSKGWLISRNDVRMAMAKPTLYEFTEISPCGDINREMEYSWECFHKGIHAWVGGTIAPATTTTFDPIFFPFHAFIDKIFELFRQKLISRGIDPEKNFPVKDIPLHGPDQKTLWIPSYYPDIESLTNQECYGNKLAALTKYSFGPRCPYCYGGTDLYCDYKLYICVSKSRTRKEKNVINTVAMETQNGVQFYDYIAIDEPDRTKELIEKTGPLPFGKVFKPNVSDPRTRGDIIPQFYDINE